jgi:hypothetical protein
VRLGLLYPALGFGSGCGRGFSTVGPGRVAASRRLRRGVGLGLAARAVGVQGKKERAAVALRCRGAETGAHGVTQASAGAAKRGAAVSLSYREAGASGDAGRNESGEETGGGRRES